MPNWLKFDAKRNLYRLFKQENFHNESDQYMDMVRQCINQAWDKWQNVAAHYEAEILKRDALIAEKDKALKAAQVSIGRLTSDEGSIQEDFDNEDTIQHALSLTHDSVRLKQLGSVKEHGGSIAVFNCIEPISVGTKLYTIVKGAEG